jgi:glutaminase
MNKPKSQTSLIATNDMDTTQDSRYRTLFNGLVDKPGGSISKKELLELFQRQGIRASDPRLKETFAAISPLMDGEKINFERFRALIPPSNLTLVERIITGDMIVPDFSTFQEELQQLFDRTAEVRHGKVASYIPQLKRVKEDAFALSFCSVDGQRVSFGDDTTLFTVQSSFKPLNYCMALELHGVEKTHKHVGREPSGQSFNALMLNRDGLPHNPLINAGAIVCASLVHPDWSLADRFDYVTQLWTAAAGGEKPGFNNAVYHSEKETADRNFALAHFMREKGAFPPKTNIHDTLDFYFQCCSMEMNTRSMAVIAGMLAKSGVCPTTDQRVLSGETVKHCLSLMSSCGMYDFSGEYAFTVGLPAKSGVSGIVLIVIPRVGGMAVWSPKLDETGNSVRGVEFSKQLVQRFNFHNFDGMVDAGGKIDPRISPAELADYTYAFIWAASKGDVSELRRLMSLGAEVHHADYDGRTALHLAAAEGQTEVVALLLEKGAAAFAADRWGNTPISEAEKAGHSAIVELLKKSSKTKSLVDILKTEPPEAGGLL